MKEQYKETTALKAKLSSRSSQDLLDNVKMVDGIKVLACQVHAMEQQDLRTLADSVRERLGSGILVIASTKDGQASFIAMVTRDLAERFSAGKILKKVAEFSGGRGGGKAEMAQGGTKQIEKVDASLEMVYEIVATMV
jgi:alanyl-tRNA synthetase